MVELVMEEFEDISLGDRYTTHLSFFRMMVFNSGLRDWLWADLTISPYIAD